MNTAALDLRGRVFSRPNILKAIPPVASIGVGVVLMAAALLKAADPRDSMAVLEFVFGAFAAQPLLYALIVTEIVLASALIAVLRPMVTLGLATALFAVFLGWIGYLELIDAPVTCGCGLPNDHWLLGDGRGAAGLRATVLFLICVAGWRLAHQFRAKRKRGWRHAEENDERF